LHEWNQSKDKVVPGNKEIKTLIRSQDVDEKISNDLMNAILKNDSSDFREEFIENRFKAWIMSNSAITGLLESIEEIKNVNRIDYDLVMQKVDIVKTIMQDKTTVNLGDNHIGLDFDDADAHNQETFLNKIPSGYEALDTMLSGGFDRKTFNVLYGGPGSGKSAWMNNFAVNFADQGFNVLYVTLELSEKKALKRMACMRLGINVREYDELSKDREYIKSRIKEHNAKSNGGMFDKEFGKIWVKEFPSGSATYTDIENVVKQVKEQTGKNVDVLMVDYIQIMATSKGVDNNMLYLKGAHLAVGIRAIGQRHNLMTMTVSQIDKNKYGANDMGLNDGSESKAIADTADTVFGIILTPPMKIEGTYHLKSLKLRDSSCEYDRIKFSFNKQTLKIDNPLFINSEF
jgi:archaellum biogenesis ATPase FlaH